MAASLCVRGSYCLTHFHRQGLTIQKIGNLFKDATVSFNSSAVSQAGAKWREEQGLPLSGNEYGILTDMPDWCYADGRPAPQSKGALRRKEEQRELAVKIDQLAQEVQEARENHRRLVKEREDVELDRQRRELKAKGVGASKFRHNNRRGKKTGNEEDAS